jgi:hypothetical protein
MSVNDTFWEMSASRRKQKFAYPLRCAQLADSHKLDHGALKVIAVEMLLCRRTS